MGKVAKPSSQRPVRSSSKAKSKSISPESSSLALEAISLKSLDGFVSFHLRRTRNLLSQRYAATAASSDVPLGSLTALAAIVDNPGLSQTALGRQLGLNKSTTVVLLDALSKLGWAERQSAADRRANALSASPLGRKKLAAMLKQLAAVEDAALETLSAEERAQLLQLLRKAGTALLLSGDDAQRRS